jgi:TatD DNase family protein
MYKIIETHCHLDYLNKDNGHVLDEIFEKSVQAGVEKIITIAVTPDNLDTVLKLSQDYSHVYCTQGVHPHNASGFNDEVFEKIKKQATKNKKVLAIGEIGLDYYYDNSPREIQIEVFERQLQLACDLDLPVVIHTREAEEDTMSILKNFSKTLKRKGVVHSFSSSLELAEVAIAEKFYLGFNGMCTFKKAQNVRDAVAITPLDQILIETDAPFLTPTPHRGKENAPYYLPFILEKVAEVKGVSPEVVATTVYQNSINLFQF